MLTFAIWYISYERWKHFNFGILISVRTETLVELVQQQTGHLVECIIIEVQFSGQFFDLFKGREGARLEVVQFAEIDGLLKAIKTNFVL